MYLCKKKLFPSSRMYCTFTVIDLKVLSSEMDLTESKFNRWVVFKEWGAEVFRKIGLTPILWQPFKDSGTPRTAIGYTRILILNAAMKFIAPLKRALRSLFRNWQRETSILLLKKHIRALESAGETFNFKRRGAFIVALLIKKWKMTNQKNFTALWGTASGFQQLHIVNKRPQIELSQDGERVDFSKNLRASLFNKYTHQMDSIFNFCAF